MSATFRVRDAKLPQDEAAMLQFINELQRFERAIEENRRVDASVAQEFLSVLLERVKNNHGCIRLAEDDHGQPIGWAVALEDEDEVYVVAGERRFGYISELHVIESWRGRGVGRALMSACEAWARDRGLATMFIAGLAENRRALDVYRASGYAPHAAFLRKYLK